MRTWRTLVNGLAFVAPSLSGKLTYAAWCRVQRTKLSSSAKECVKNATRDALLFDGKIITVYVWGEGRSILLVHGWNGWAAQYTAFITALVKQNYRVIAFDAPGHGESAGSQTNIKEIAEIISLLSRQYGEFQGIVGHSFGFMAVVRALRGKVKAQAIIGLNSPADFTLLLQAYAIHAGLNSRALIALERQIKVRYGISHFNELSVPSLPERLQPACLIVHDRCDRYVPVSEAHKITSMWQGAEPLITAGLGHTRVLRNAQVVDKVIEFLNKHKLC